MSSTEKLQPLDDNVTHPQSSRSNPFDTTMLLALNEDEIVGLHRVVGDYRLCDLCRIVTHEADKALAEHGSFQHHSDARLLITEALEKDPHCRLCLMIFLALDPANE
jgi:hypothetical protein